jgi:DNA-binding NarL/FixJ family response regulator
MTMLQEAESCLARALVHYGRGETGRCRTQLRAGLELARGSGTAVEARLLIEEARLSVLEWDPPAVLAAALEAASAARAAGAHLAEAELVLGQALYVNLSPACIARYRSARRAARRAGNAPTELDAVVWLSAALHAFGRPLLALRAGEYGARRATALHKPMQEAHARWGVARIRLYAFAELDRAIGELTQLRDHPALGVGRPQLEADLAVALADAGRLDEARTRIAHAASLAHAPAMRGAVAWARSEVEWTSGRPSRALAATDEALEQPLDPMAREAISAVRRWALYDLGRPERDLGSALGDAFSRVQRVESQAFAALADGDLVRAHATFLRAAEEWHGLQPRDGIRALWAAGRSAAAAGRPAETQKLLLDAERRANAAGLEAILARIRQSLRSIEQDRDRRRPPPVGLSRRERYVLEFVAAGRSSPQIAAATGLARSTVETHVRAAMAKLGARTRIQAARLAATPPTASDTPELPGPELALLELLAEGASVTEAARLLQISRRTAARRLDAARGRLSVATNAEAIAVLAGRRPADRLH